MALDIKLPPAEQEDVIETLNHYFRQLALSRHIPLPRWATW